jgi:PAS domain S-box-containing protein
VRYADGLLSDSAERIQVEGALRESEKRYRGLVDHATVGIYRTTPDGRILTANPALIKKLGYTDFQSLAARNLEAEGSEPSYLRTSVRERIEQERQVIGMEEAWTRRDGSQIWVRESARASQDEDGKTLCYEGIVEDIAERKQAQTELADRLRFETLLAELSRRFVHLPTEQIDGEIVDARRRVCECLALDTCSLWQVRTAAPDFISLAHVYRRPGNAWILERINADQDFPWSAKQILAGKVAAFSSLEELPTEAGRDRQTFQLLGNRSVLAVGLSVGGGPIVAGLVFATRTERTWPEEIVKQLQLVAQMFSIALIRQRADAALRERESIVRLFAEHSPAAIAMLDRKMRYLAVSQRWMTGYRLGGRNIEGLSHYEVFPDIPERWKEVHRRCPAGGDREMRGRPLPTA